MSLIEPLVEAILEAETAVTILLEHRPCRMRARMTSIHAAAVAHVVDVVCSMGISTVHSAVSRVVPWNPVMGREGPNVGDRGVVEGRMHGDGVLLDGRVAGYIDVTVTCHLLDRFDVAALSTTLNALVAVLEHGGEIFPHLKLRRCQLVLRLHLELLLPCHQSSRMKLIHVDLVTERVMVSGAGAGVVRWLAALSGVCVY